MGGTGRVDQVNRVDLMCRCLGKLRIAAWTAQLRSRGPRLVRQHMPAMPPYPPAAAMPAYPPADACSLPVIHAEACSFSSR